MPPEWRPPGKEQGSDPIGLAASWFMLIRDGLGRGPMPAAPALGIGLLLGALAGELVAPRSHGPIRGASPRWPNLVDPPRKRLLPCSMRPRPSTCTAAFALAINETWPHPGGRASFAEK